jgi:hypothetical protein
MAPLFNLPARDRVVRERALPEPARMNVVSVLVFLGMVTLGAAVTGLLRGPLPCAAPGCSGSFPSWTPSPAGSTSA